MSLLSVILLLSENFSLFGAGMADAIDGSEIVLYCLSQEYKESANCKLEALVRHNACCG